jgi:AraC-like DNA-binding protein
MSREETTINTWAIALVRTLDARGCDGRALVVEAGLDPAMLTDPNGRAPVGGMTRLWRLAVDATGDPCLGLRVSAFVQPATFHSLGLALLMSQNLEDALERMARFSRIVSNVADVRTEPGRGGVKLVARWLADSPVVPEAIDLLMASALKMGLLLLGQDPSAPRPIELSLRRSATPEMRAEFAKHFACPIHFDADENWLLIPDEWINRSLPMANPQLAQQTDLVVMDYLARFDGARLAEKVRSELISRLPAGEPARADVASALNLSEKTLQRRLREEDTSFQQVLDEIRRDLALKYLHDGRTSVCAVTFKLGFSDQSSFTRAFRRWTGETPGEYRARPQAA